jgi:glycosyltransferase involved in cell wall biosynthesis
MPEAGRNETTGARASVAYVLKGYPRISELFIASEIYRLEQAGLPLRLFAIKRGEDAFRHPIVDRIHARPVYLPATSPVSDVGLWRWMREHLPAFLPALRRTAAAAPSGVVRAAAAAFAQAVRARRTFWSAPRKVYAKEFLQAVALADQLLDAPDVRHLHAHFCHGATTVTWLAAIITGRSFSFTAHAKDLYTPSLNPAGLLQRKLAAARFAVTCTETNRAYLRQRAGRTPVYCVYHGLNTEFADLLRREIGATSPVQPGQVLRVVSVGRHVRKKGFDVLVDACAELVAHGVRIEATLIGEPAEETRYVIARIRRLGLDGCVRIAGAMPQAALLREYQRASVFCLPCRVTDDGDRDGIPNVLVEAMASGLPVVTTAVSGIPELVHDEVTGLIVPPDDPVRTAGALLRIHRDPALARRLAAAAQADVASRFDGDRLIKELQTLFARVA